MSGVDARRNETVPDETPRTAHSICIHSVERSPSKTCQSEALFAEAETWRADAAISEPDSLNEVNNYASVLQRWKITTCELVSAIQTFLHQ